jgi:hypothetical protein
MEGLAAMSDAALSWQVAPCVFCSRFVMQGAEHADDCPSNTGLYPVLQQDLEPHGFGCTACGHQFELGEFYTHRPTGESGDGTPVVSVVCMDCAAFNREEMA